ncbi:hypothetical protein BsWGS_04213 [Bradybaena similaris]
MSLVVKNMDDLEQMDESELEELYSWVDKIPLSRPKKNIARDFSDGVMIAELVKHFLPHIVSLHNYTPAAAVNMKLDNWRLLNRKVFSKLNFQLTEDLIRELCLGKAGLIERFLMHLRAKIEKANWDMQKDAGDRKEMAEKVSKSSQRLYTNPKGTKTNYNDKPEADQDITVSPGRLKQQPNQVAVRGNVKVRSTDETVPRAVYEEKEQECLSKEETIQILQAKVRRLEHLLQLKDLRIEDLQSKLDTVKPLARGMR